MDYADLYALQDRVLRSVLARETAFYLTAGRCLHRFHTEKRHSDDFDLFISETALFRDDFRAARSAIQEARFEVETMASSVDFWNRLRGSSGAATAMARQ